MNKKDEKTFIKPYVRQFYRGNIGYLATMLLAMLIAVASSLMIAWLLQMILDMLGGVDVGYSIGELVVITVVCIILSLLESTIRCLSEPRFIAKARLQYQSYVFSKLTQKSISAFSNENTSKYLSALSNDINSIETGYLSKIIPIFYNTIVFFAALGMMLSYNLLLTLISVAIAVLPFAISMLTGSLLEKSEREVSDKSEVYTSTLKDFLAGFTVVKSFRAEKQAYQLFYDKSKNVADGKEHRKKIVIILNSLSDFGRYVLQFGVLLVGAWLAFSDSSISAGTVFVFVQLLNYVINPIGVIPQALAEWKASTALITKIAYALENNVREDGEIEKRKLDNGITVRNLTFAYEENKRVLNDLSFTFEAGKSYCLVGSSGSGKSTLLNLLMASHHNYSGSISYDEAELKSIRSEALYDMISVIQQNVFIFNASIRDNITMFSDFPREAVDRAIEMSGLSELIAERGEDYLCGENGNGLSGGEKQRISIARSLLKKSQVLLVDEATAALDTHTAAQVTNAILGLDGITRIVVTHALDEALLKQYDCILTLKNGNIAESGSFDDLMSNKGYFYSLFTVAQ